MEIPFRGSSDWLTPSPSTAEGPQRLRHDERRVGTFTGHQRGPLPGHQWGLNEEWGLSLATSGDRYLATNGDFVMATDNPARLSMDRARQASCQHWTLHGAASRAGSTLSCRTAARLKPVLVTFSSYLRATMP